MNPSPKFIILQGKAGAGKSMMACLTAVHKPVHVMDIDRKIQAAGWAQAALASKELTYWELKETLTENKLRSRLDQLVKNEKSATMPHGWNAFAEYMYALPTSPEGQAAGTWFLDSWTVLNEHCKSHINWVCLLYTS